MLFTKPPLPEERGSGEVKNLSNKLRCIMKQGVRTPCQDDYSINPKTFLSCLPGYDEIQTFFPFFPLFSFDFTFEL